VKGPKGRGPNDFIVWPSFFEITRLAPRIKQLASFNLTSKCTVNRGGQPVRNFRDYALGKTNGERTVIGMKKAEGKSLLYKQPIRR
jgi:hypothetical protein